ncbi:6-pyruvoyltetrahydropterin/6-carboxytetrahydropterin synthase [Saccharicrinis carchari]|uniref:6-carboxy-5,6,7,8-tetrahydropterin synthase n=1 Tax=Saccharicrinis carchari TaxID=1168039 RepID=A0A521BZW0_SACCC|nr:6-pyruvoyl tetrahydropterin synthase family protein [Saccharicrinis carchari]SMO52635.1 6-pyruvoyltetrahydropterin/6-carboxytetrahydropterin synthase [Saccharicrinis carchari]
MIIRKKFKFEGAHIVRDCSSDRCKKSLHGHSYVVEVFLSSNKLDFGHMIYDFGLTKGTIKDIIDSFDHAYAMWDKESDEFKTFIRNNSERYIEMPVSPSAECFALTLLFLIDKTLQATEFKNGEGKVSVSSVRVHETDTGYAEAFRKDLDWFTFELADVTFSQAVKDEWKDAEMYDKLLMYHKGELDAKPFVNPQVERIF